MTTARGVGSLPICGEDDRLAGMVTDRDIVVHCVADNSGASSTTVETHLVAAISSGPASD